MKIFWATPDMVLAARASSAPLFLDATYNFTKSVLKLVVPCTVGPDNTTTVIGVAMIFQEDERTWNWILEKLKQVCGFNEESPQTCPLTTIICDEDRAMGSAIDAHAKDYPDHFHRHILPTISSSRTSRQLLTKFFAVRAAHESVKCSWTLSGA